MLIEHLKALVAWHTITHIEVISPDRKTLLKLPLSNEYIVTGRKTKTEKGQPTRTPAAATETAKVYFSSRKRAEDSVTAYMENVLGRKPEEA